MIVDSIAFGDLYRGNVRSVNPAKLPDEAFDLYSVPAYEGRVPESVLGSQIGSSKAILESGDTVLCKIVPHIRRAWVIPEAGSNRQLGSGEWIVLRHKQVDPNYLRHLLLADTFHSQFMNTVAGVGGSLMRARPAQAAAIRIPLPPLPEQRRIASILDQADNLRTKRRSALSELDAMPDEILDCELRNADSLPRKVELQELVKSGTSVTYGIVQAGVEVEGGVRYIRTGDIVDGEIRIANLRRTSPEIANKFPRSRVSEGDIVMSIRATVGTTALIDAALDGANLTQGTARISPGHEVTSDFLLAYLRSPSAQQWISAQVKGATFREITLGRLRELPVTVVSSDSQRRVSQSLQSLARLKALQKTHLTKLDELFASLQHRAFRGEL